MVAAIQTPIKINGSDFLKGISKIKAASEPDHEPVNGSGIATKIMRAIAPYFAYLPAKA